MAKFAAMPDLISGSLDLCLVKIMTTQVEQPSSQGMHVWSML